MRKNNKILYLSVISLCVLSSCRHKELCYDHNHDRHTVAIEFDWSEAPTADPETMSLYLFDSEGNYYTQYQFSGKTGGNIELTTGTYSAIVLNDDSDTEFVGGSATFESFNVTTNKVSLLSTFLFLSRAGDAPRAAGTEDEIVNRYPSGRLWGDSAQGIEITEDCTITFVPKKKTSTVSVEIINVKNIEYITGLSAALSSLAPSLYIGIDKPTEGKVTHPFDLSADTAAGVLQGGLQIFGHCPDSHGTHSLTVYLTLTDGKAYYHTYDVTSQIEDAPDQKNIRILLDGLSVPEPVNIGGGLTPSVDDWKSIEIELPMF